MKSKILNSQIKINLSFILFLISLVIAIFLSFKLRVVQQSVPDMIEREKQAIERKKQILNYRLFLINETLKANYKLSGTKIPAGNYEHFYEAFLENSIIPVLYLKKYACSDCYLMTIIAILERMSQWEAFSVISHSSNSYFVDEMKDAGILPAYSRVIWTDKELPHGGGLHSIADLLILNPDMTIRFFLPLDFLNDSYFYEEYMLFLENELMQELTN